MMPGQTPSMRAAERADLESLTAAFLRDGGAITALDHAGRVSGVVAVELPPEPAPAPELEPEPAGEAAEPQEARQRATAPCDVIAELRAIRAAARALSAQIDRLEAM